MMKGKFPYGKNKGVAHFVAHRLSTTSIYGNNGQLSEQLSLQPTTSKYENSRQLSGQWSGLPRGNLAAHYFHIWKQ